MQRVAIRVTGIDRHLLQPGAGILRWRFRPALSHGFQAPQHPPFGLQLHCLDLHAQRRQCIVVRGCFAPACSQLSQRLNHFVLPGSGTGIQLPKARLVEGHAALLKPGCTQQHTHIHTLVLQLQAGLLHPRSGIEVQTVIPQVSLHSAIRAS